MFIKRIDLISYFLAKEFKISSLVSLKYIQSYVTVFKVELSGVMLQQKTCYLYIMYYNPTQPNPLNIKTH